MERFSLAGDFPPALEADWLALVGKALGEAPFEALRTGLHEGLKTEPLYTRSNARPPLSSSRGWHIVQPLTADAGQHADDLQAGDCAHFIDFGAGLTAQSVDSLKHLLGSDIPYYLAPGPIANAALALAADANASIRGAAGFDPLAAFALSGERPADASALFADYVDAAFYIREHRLAFVPFLASGHAWDGAGGSAAQELAFTLAAGVSYWRALAQAEMPLAAAAGCIGFSLSASADIFLTIAKFRAMRLLWARALEVAGEAPNANLLLLAKMPHRILTAYDRHVNLLRGTAAAFGAAIGGATGIEVLPFDGASGGATAFARRMARNTSLILQQESYLSAVADAAAGSAYIETLTDGLAAAAWALFREVEAKGGLAAAIESGFVYEELRRKASERERAIAYRQDKITGVSVFPNLAETPTFAEGAAGPQAGDRHPFTGKLLELPAPNKGERFAALIEAAHAGLALPGLRLASRRVPAIAAPALGACRRDAEPFEMLRECADEALDIIGSRPPIFVAILGKPEDYRARANWVQGLFAVGGIEAIVPERGFDTPEALAEAFKQSPAPAACLCSSNGGYARLPGAAAALKKAGALAVYLAGPPSVLKTLAPQDAVAIDRLVHEGCNVLALLREAHAVLHVEELSAAAEKEAAEEGFEVHTHVHGHGCGCC